jgi:hypothetical protein
MNLAEVDPERRAAVALDEVAAARQQWQRANRRPRSMSARDALAALQFEALLVAVAAGNLASGVELSEQDRERLAPAYRRIDEIASEAT